ncbi:MAG: hypothetical protein JXR83_18940, partial [Deltaproteobacteria bacterium]|nr:hypothetical protein [Deltaproteobacteria bacterium]
PTAVTPTAVTPTTVTPIAHAFAARAPTAISPAVAAPVAATVAELEASQVAVPTRRGNQLALNLKLTGSVRDDLKRGIEDLLRVCDESEHDEVDPSLLMRSKEMADGASRPATEVGDVG